MNTQQRFAVTAGVAVLVIGGGAVVLFSGPIGTDFSAPMTGNGSVGEQSGEPVDSGEWSTLLELDVSGAAAALPAEIEGFEDLFLSAVDDTLMSYTIPDVQGYLEWQASQGIAPTPRWVADPASAQRYWDGGRAVIADAVFDVSRARARMIEDRSAVGPPLDGGPYWVHREIRRDEGRVFLAEGETVATELIMPGRFPGKPDEGVIEADLGIEMVWDRVQQRWVVSALRFYHPGPPGGNGRPVNFAATPPI